MELLISILSSFKVAFNAYVTNRYFGNETDNQQEKEELQTLVTRIFALLGAFIISDYVPWLSFITKLQGWHSKFEDLRDFKDKVTTKLFEVEKHRQRAEERKKGHIDEDYVPDFVDVLLEAPLENGNPLPTSDLILVLMVRICNLHILS